MKKLGTATALIGALLLLTGCGAQDARLQSAADECDSDGDTGVTVGDGGATLIFDMRGDEDTEGGSYLTLVCLLHVLDAPDRVTNHMGQTTSQDGRQSDTWDGITASWSYHPDRGLDGMFVYDD